MISFDVIRIVSCLVIFYYHFLMNLVSNGIRQMDDVRHLYGSKNLNIVTVAVGLFFFISGAGLMASSQNNNTFSLGKYFYKRFKAILIPYYIAFVIYVVTYRLLYGYGTRAALWGTTPTWRLIFTVLGIDGYISQYGVATFYCGIGEWFLGSILFAYLLFPILRFLLIKYRWITFFIMTLLFVVCSYYYDSITLFTPIPPYTNAFMKLYEFFLGMFFVTQHSDEPASLIHKGIKGSILKAKYHFIYAILAIPVLYYYWFHPTWLPYNNRIVSGRILVQNLAAFLFFVGLEDLFVKIKTKSNILKLISELSYYVFLVHHVVISHVPYHVPFNVSTTRSVIALFFLELILSVAFAIIIKLLSHLVFQILNAFYSKITKSAVKNDYIAQ